MGMGVSLKRSDSRFTLPWWSKLNSARQWEESRGSFRLLREDCMPTVLGKPKCGLCDRPSEAVKDPVEGVQEDDSHPGRMEQDSLRLVHTTGNRVWLTTQLPFILGIFYFRFSSHSSIVQMENLEYETPEKRKDMASTNHTETSLHQWGFGRNSKW